MPLEFIQGLFHEDLKTTKFTRAAFIMKRMKNDFFGNPFIHSVKLIWHKVKMLFIESLFCGYNVW